MMASQSKTIMWFRRDLRIEDNPAFLTASKEGVVLPVFIWCPSEEGQFYPGRCSRWWLKQSLAHLDQALKSIGAPLVCIWAESTISALLRWIGTIGATKVVYNHLYDPISLIRDHAVKSQLMDHGIIVQSFNGNLLYEPWEVYDESGNAFTTFEEFWNKCLSLPAESVSFLPPWKLVPPSGIESVENCSIEELGLEKESEKSSNALLSRGWSPGWSNADKILSKFLGENLLNYSKNSMRLEESTTSLLSPYLHFGEVSVRKVFQNVRMLQIQWKKEGTFVAAESANFFLRSIGLREYSRYLCFNFPFTHERSLLGNLKHYPWRADQEQFKAWRQGRTGYPLVDAGMRELWATGWIHNRIRVIVASFFVKFLLLPWTWGLKYFWDTLLDADLESDILGWQYISGSLPDGHELTRLDNPEEQGQRFDPEGEYIRNWIPELARMPTQFIHHPWDAPTTVLKAAGIELGSNYPKPIVEINTAMERLVDAVSMMWESDRAARDARFNSTGEVFADNHTMNSFYIPNVVVKKEAFELAPSLDQRVPSFHDVVINPAVKKEVKLDDDLRSTAESSSAKKRSIRERHISVPSSCSSVIDSGSQCEDDMFKPSFLAGSPSSQPAEKDEEGGAESTNNGLRPCKRPA